MSGQAGGRGYLIQAVIAVLDALHDRTWTECVLEPMLDAEKVDLLFRSADGDRVSQIKSSENAIGAANVRKWAAELEAAYSGAKQYELRLIGPVTGGAASVTRVGRVDVPTPQALNIGGLLEQCAHQLDRYLRDIGHGSTRPVAREMLAQAIATRLGQLAAFGKGLSRKELQDLLADWVAELLPPDASDNTKVPHQLPGPPDDFVGRVEELTLLREVVDRNDVRVILIRGLAGVGKSALAASAAASIENSYPDGQVYIDLREADLSSPPRTRALAEVIQAFTPTYPVGGDEARCLSDFRTLLNGRRVLILAENVESAEQVLGLIPPTAESLLIVTTQSRFDLPGSVLLNLDILSNEDGTKLVQLIAPRVADVAPLLAEICGHLPLAIRIACGTLNARPDLFAEEYIERLTGLSERARLVRTALDVTFAHLPAEIVRFLSATAAFAKDFDADGLAAILDQSNDVTDTQLGVAIGRHLIEWDDRRKRYHLHELVRAYIADVSDSTIFSDLLTRHAHYYSDLCSHIDDLYREGGEATFDAIGLFDSESSNIAAGFSFCCEHAPANESAAKVCTAFVRGLTHVMDLRLSPIVRAQILVSGLEAAKTLGDTGLTVLHTGNLGRAYKELGELDLALECQEWVLKKATTAGHREDQAYAHHHIGLVLLQQGNFLAGVHHLEEALKLSRDPELAMKSLEAGTLNNLGTAYLQTHQPAKALNYFRPALDLADELQDPRLLSFTMTNLGISLVTARQEPALAVEMLQSALGIATDLSDRQSQFTVRARLADAYAQAGRPDDAMEVAKLQHSEAARIGYTHFEVDALQTLGDLYLASGEIMGAESSFEMMLQIAHDRDDRSAQCKALNSMAQLAEHKGDRETAIKFLDERLALLTEAREIALAAWSLGNLLATDGKRERAVALMSQAIGYFESINHECVDSMRDEVRRIERRSD